MSDERTVGAPVTSADSTVRRTVLPGGLRVVTEFLPAVRSVALGIWVGVGSRDEDETHAGATHYLEHLLFKGTGKRTALEISAEMDAVGGELNAFTAKEYTCYYARVLDSDLPLAIDVLSDMVNSSVIASQDVDAERGVILEEIAMNEDDPSDLVHEAFAAQLFGDTPLGRPILGTVDSINDISRDRIWEHYRARYTPDNLVVAAAGLGIGTTLAGHVLATAIELNEKAACRAVIATAPECQRPIVAGAARVPCVPPVRPGPARSLSAHGRDRGNAADELIGPRPPWPATPQTDNAETPDVRA